MSAGDSLRSPGVTLVNYKGDIISKYVHLSFKIDITRKNTKFVNFYLTSALRACLRCAAGGHFVSAGGSLRSPGVTLVNYKGDNISKYVCSTVLIDITRKITKFVNFRIF